MDDPRLGPASHPRPAKLSVTMPSAKTGSMGTLLSSQSMFMLTSSTAPAVPPMAIVTMLLASWNRRRVFRSWKKPFQSSLGAGAEDGRDGPLDADAVLAWRRAAKRHCTDGGLRVVGRGKEGIFVESCRDDTWAAARGGRASDGNGAE